MPTLSVTVIVAVPIATPVIVTTLPITVAVATAGFDEVGVYGGTPPEIVDVVVAATATVTLAGDAGIQLLPALLVTVKTPVPAELAKLTSTVPGVADAGTGFDARVTVTVAGNVPLLGVILMPGEPPGVAIVPA